MDTSVIGGCFDEEFAPWSNGLLKDFQQGHFKPVVSEVVSAEIDDAPEVVKQKYGEILSLGAAVLLVVRQAQTWPISIRRNVLSPKFYDDGLHIALASIAEVDILVSWNFKHIVHFDKIHLFTAVNLELGYRPLLIYSPREVTHYGEE